MASLLDLVTGGGGIFKSLGWGKSFDQRRAEDDARALAEGRLTPTELEAMGRDPGSRVRRSNGTAVVPGAGPMPVPYQPTLPISYTPPAQQQAMPALAQLPKIGSDALMGGGWTTGGSLVSNQYLRSMLPTVPRAQAIAQGFRVVNGLVIDQAGKPIGKVRRRRRINPLNYRAAMRAARRLGLVQDLVGRINKALPSAGKKLKVRSRRRK